ncbi:MAG: hypothetical protein D5R97_02740 [Candidatus Syntrophonatronum acetioxidans]|uniref:Uncharacterized protein n=1 Tax=Candidatus Syntrophonatronum acetioxidans TaxID=1795816 RepID=A0A424YGV9_9FIRM|nr:MAG: hypothetical protein D5R97_02740 [Candidatus Syntrophonatronum acetioxidans]
MLKKAFLILLVFLLMGSMFYGCGSPANQVEEEETREEEMVIDEMEETEPDEFKNLPLRVDDWEAPTSLQELAFTYREIRHSWSENGEEVASVHYLFEGSEEVEGIHTDKISFHINEEDFTLWIDAEGNTRKIEVGGEDMPVEMGDMMFMPLVSSIFMPFYISQEWKVDQMLAHPDPGVYIKKTGETRETIGDLTGTVHTFEVTLEPPEVPQGEKGKVRWKIADFGLFQMLVGWEALERVGEELALEFTIDRLSLQ